MKSLYWNHSLLSLISPASVLSSLKVPLLSLALTNQGQSIVGWRVCLYNLSVMLLLCLKSMHKKFIRIYISVKTYRSFLTNNSKQKTPTNYQWHKQNSSKSRRRRTGEETRDTLMWLLKDGKNARKGLQSGAEVAIFFLSIVDCFTLLSCDLK